MKENDMFRNNDNRWADTARALADDLPGATAELYALIADSGKVDRAVDVWLQGQPCQMLKALEDDHARKATGAPASGWSSKPTRRRGDQAELMDIVLERIRTVRADRKPCSEYTSANWMTCPHTGQAVTVGNPAGRKMAEIRSTLDEAAGGHAFRRR